MTPKMTPKSKTLITGALLLSLVAGGAAWAHGAAGMGHGKDRRGAGEGGPSVARMFERLDSDKDGLITEAEIAAAAAARFAEADSDGDGFLSAEELAAHAQARRGTAEADHAAKGANGAMGAMGAERQARLMDRLDTDKDGRLSPEEVAAQGPSQRLQRMLERLDSDGDGAISRAEAEAGAETMRGKRAGRHADGGAGHGHGRGQGPRGTAPAQD